jgi:polar amino acid transport system permease protein
MDYRWNFQVVSAYSEALLHGVGITLLLTICSVVPGTILGAAVAWGRLSSRVLVRICSQVYIEIFFALPVLVLLVWGYYCLPLLFNIKMTAFQTAWLCLTLSLAAFVAEIVRAGVTSIPKGEIEAGRVLGLTRWQIFRLIVFPQAFRRMIPAILGQYITALKLSSLASVIGVSEVIYQTQLAIARTYRPLELYSVAAFAYIIIVLPLSLLMKRYETRTQSFG